MNPRLLYLFKLFPIFSLIFTIWVLYICISVVDDVSVSFIFFSFQFYIHWLIILIRNNPWAKNVITQGELIEHNKLWFCPKCNKNSTEFLEHCPLCNKCIVLRDHHCFFLGTCINHKNVNHFIFILLYIVLICGYALFTLFYFLRDEFLTEEDIDIWDLTSRFFYPVMFGRWLSGKDELYVFSLTAMFDMLVSIELSTFIYGVYQLYRIAVGRIFKKHRVASSPLSVKENLQAIFGKWGLLALVFPIPFTEPDTFQYNKQPKYK